MSRPRRTATAQAGLVLAAFDRLDAAYPEKLGAVLARHGRIRANHSGDRPQDDLLAAYADALDAGRDPHTDKAVTRHLAAGALADLDAPLNAMLIDELDAAITADPAAIVAAWRPAFDAATVAAAHTVLAGASLDDSNAILRRGGSAAQAWGDAHAALKPLHQIRESWLSLATGFTGHGRLSPGLAYIWCCTGDPATITDQPHDHTKPRDPWLALDQGLALRLNSPDEAADLADQVDQAREGHRLRAERDAKPRRPPIVLSA